jgi:cell division protein FtsL
MNPKEKSELLKEYEEIESGERNLSFSTLLIAYLLIILGLLIFLPKVYIKNKIYYTSRDINKLYREYSTQKEENEALKKKIEYLKYKTDIADTIF